MANVVIEPYLSPAAASGTVDDISKTVFDNSIIISVGCFGNALFSPRRRGAGIIRERGPWLGPANHAWA